MTQFAKYFPVKSINWFIGVADRDHNCQALTVEQVQTLKAQLSVRAASTGILADISNFKTALGSNNSRLNTQFIDYTVAQATFVNIQLQNLDQSTVGAFLLQTIQPIAPTENPQDRVDQANHQIISLNTQTPMTMLDELERAFTDDREVFEQLKFVITQFEKTLPVGQHACLMAQVNWEVA